MPRLLRRLCCCFPMFFRYGFTKSGNCEKQAAFSGKGLLRQIGMEKRSGWPGLYRPPAFCLDAESAGAVVFQHAGAGGGGAGRFLFVHSYWQKGCKKRQHSSQFRTNSCHTRGAAEFTCAPLRRPPFVLISANVAPFTSGGRRPCPDRADRSGYGGVPMRTGAELPSYPCSLRPPVHRTFLGSLLL